MDVSPYLAAIQLVNGKDPGSKYRELHRIAIEIINDASEKEEFLIKGVSKRTHPALISFLRILIGNKLKDYDIVVESLKSHDINVVRQALKARWFFNSSNSYINVENFVTNIVPYISLKTRLALIRKLASCLVKDTAKANNFFSTFADLYGVEQALPLITACSEQYIYNEILKRKLKFSIKILNILYVKYPELVIQYLQLGNKENKENEEDRIKFKIRHVQVNNYKNEKNEESSMISINDYKKFLPSLVKYHTRAFVALYKCCEIKYNENSESGIKLGNTRTIYFLKNATDELIQNPTVFLDILSLKIVSDKLNTEQFEKMYENLFPNKDNDIFFTTNIKKLVKYLKYYPTENKLNFILEKYRLTYNKDLMASYNFITELEFFEIVPKHLKEMWGRKMYDVSINEYKLQAEENIHLLPPSEVYNKLTESIDKHKVAIIPWLFNSAINSCFYYEDEDALLKVLQYYNTKLRKERIYLLEEIFSCLCNKNLNKKHWYEIRKIIKRAYVEGYLFNGENKNVLSPFLEYALHYYLNQREPNNKTENQVFLEELIDIILQVLFKQNIKWDFMKKYSNTGKDCLEIFLTAIPQKYPYTDSVWKEKDNKLWITRYMIQTMLNFNKINSIVTTKQKDNSEFPIIDSEKKNPQINKFTIKDYPWLISFAQDLLKTGDSSENKKLYLDFKMKLRKHDYEYYQSLIDNDPDLINDVRTVDGLIVLKHQPAKVFAKWKLYLNNCRKYAHKRKGYTKQFVKLTKWYHDLPIKFVKKCLFEIEEKNNLLLLGLLLEGEVFSKVVEPYLPKSEILDSNDKDVNLFCEIQSLLPKSMSYTNPPVPFEIVSLLCQNTSGLLVSKFLLKLMQRVAVSKAITFIDDLMNKSIIDKKLGITVFSKIAPKPVLYNFLVQIWNQESDFSIRLIIIEMIFHMNFDFDKPKPELCQFLKQMWIQKSNSLVCKTVEKIIYNTFILYPNLDSWELMRLYIQSLTNNYETFFKLIENLNDIDGNYLTLYIQEYLKKIEIFESSELDKDELFCRLVKNINSNIAGMLSDELITYLFKKHFDGCISCENESFHFELGSYLFCDLKKFDERLEIILSILKNNMKYQKYSIDTILYNLLKHKNRDMCLRLVNGISEIFLEIYRPWEVEESLIIYKLYYESTSVKEFGFKCCETATMLIKEFGSELRLFSIAYDIRNILKKSDIYKEQTSKVMVLESLMEFDKRLGALIGIEVVREDSSNKEMCLINVKNQEKLLKIWVTVEDVTVKAAWNMFLAGYLLTDDNKSTINYCKRCFL